MDLFLGGVRRKKGLKEEGIWDDLLWGFKWEWNYFF